MANRLKFNERFIQITCDRGDAASIALATQIPYIHSNRISTVFHTSIRNIDLVLKLFRNIDETNVDKVPEAIRALYNKEMQRRLATAALIEHGPDGDSDFLMRHQQLGRELAQVNDRWGFFYDTRTGKTILSLQIIKDDIDLNPSHKWLVLCPLILIENAWMLDAQEFFPDMSVVSLHAPLKAKRLKLFKQQANVYIMNIESFVAYRPYIEAMGFHGCFVDESSAMKSNSTKFSKEAVDFAYTVKRWYLLSGTPAPNGEWEYYNQLQSIDYFGIHQSYARFTQYFFDNISRSPQYPKLKTKPERYEELMQLIQASSLYVDKEDVLTTPGRDFETIELTLPVELKSHYTKMKNELSIELGDGLVINSPSTAANLNKLNQISSGFVIDTLAIKHNKMVKRGIIDEPLKEETHLLSMYRFEALYSLLDSFGSEQAIVWCNFRKEFEIIKERLGNMCAIVNGAVNSKEKTEAIQAFKQGKVQFLIANPASADKGLTLTNAHIAVYFSMNYSYETWKQSLERIYGDIKKQPERCIYYIIQARGTVDTPIYNTVKVKGDMSSAILTHLKGGI